MNVKCVFQWCEIKVYNIYIKNKHYCWNENVQYSTGGVLYIEDAVVFPVDNVNVSVHRHSTCIWLFPIFCSSNWQHEVYIVQTSCGDSLSLNVATQMLSEFLLNKLNKEWIRSGKNKDKSWRSETRWQIWRTQRVWTAYCFCGFQQRVVPSISPNWLYIDKKNYCTELVY